MKQEDQSGGKDELSSCYSARGLEALGRNIMDKYASFIHSPSTCYIPDSGRVLANKWTWQCLPTLYSLMEEMGVNSVHKYAIAKSRRKLWKKHASSRML